MNPKVIISLNNLYSNLKHLNKKNIMPVIKANAYGHGAVKIAKFLKNKINVPMCVATYSEVMELIDNKIDAPILHLGKLNSKRNDLFLNSNVRCTINSLSDIQMINTLTKKYKAKLICHLKIDTGMKRMGCDLSDYNSILKNISENKMITLEGVYSHLACSTDIDNINNKYQIERFNKIVNKIKQKYDIKYYHLLNSSGLYNFSKYVYDSARVGLSMYGISPFNKIDNNLNPVMEFKAPLILTKEIKKGEGVGYDCTYIAENDIKIGIIQCGYADGVPTEFGNSGEVEFDGEYYPILGKISMDLTCIKINNHIKVDDWVTIWGGKNDRMKIETLSKKFNILPYVFLTNISSRVDHSYV